jgi:hypothetical protein
MAISRGDIPPVTLPEETLHMAALGGEVLVRGMDMVQLLDFLERRRTLMQPMDGEAPDAAETRAGHELIPSVLATAVLADDGLPVYTAPQWRAWGASHVGDALALFNLAMRLSGSDVQAEKKS